MVSGLDFWLGFVASGLGFGLGFPVSVLKSRLPVEAQVQGCLAHEKRPPPYDNHRYSTTVGSLEGSFFHERGTPVNDKGSASDSAASKRRGF